MLITKEVCELALLTIIIKSIIIIIIHTHTHTYIHIYIYGIICMECSYFHSEDKKPSIKIVSKLKKKNK